MIPKLNVAMKYIQDLSVFIFNKCGFMALNTIALSYFAQVLNVTVIGARRNISTLISHIPITEQQLYRYACSDIGYMGAMLVCGQHVKPFLTWTPVLCFFVQAVRGARARPCLVAVALHDHGMNASDTSLHLVCGVVLREWLAKLLRMLCCAVLCSLCPRLVCGAVLGEWLAKLLRVQCCAVLAMPKACVPAYVSKRFSHFNLLCPFL